MDNLTHSVVGLGIGALIDRSVPPDTSYQRRRSECDGPRIACALMGR